MIPTSKEIAMQIAVMHERYPKATISELAQKLMYSPIFIINALDEGEKLELFNRSKGDDKLITSIPIDYGVMMGDEFGKENARIQNEIIRVVSAANRDEDDVEEGTLNLWLRGIRPADIEIALHSLQQLQIIVRYELPNPKDKKSKYAFYTLRINEGQEWGKKQFKDIKPKSKKTK
jgi:hypothetical protein